MSLHIDLDARTLAEAIGRVRGEPADGMPDPYHDELASCGIEWRWLPVAALMVAGCGMVASYVWPWGVL